MVVSDFLTISENGILATNFLDEETFSLFADTGNLNIPKLETHLENQNNPHGITPAQLNLATVEAEI